MQPRWVIVLAAGALGAGSTVPVHAFLPIPAAPVPGLGFLGVVATGVVALIIGWWRMRK